MKRLSDLFYKLVFICRWYFWYNLELTLLHAAVPKGVPIWSSGKLARRSMELDQRRQEAQSTIYDTIRNYGSVCAACGACCKERVSRFTTFDMAVRAAGPMPLSHYGKEILHLPWILTNGLTHTAQRLGRMFTPKKEVETVLCRHLGTTGCTLAHAERPMLCASWFCPKYLWHVQTDDLKKLAPLLIQMERLHWEGARLLRANSRPPHSKNASESKRLC